MRWATNLRTYLKNSEDYSFTRMVLEFTAVAFGLKAILIILLRIFFGEFKTSTDIVNDTFDPKTGMIVVLLAAPVVETILYQFLPIKILSRFLNKPVVLTAISMILFVGIHAFETTIFSIALVPLAGLLAWSTVIWLKRSMIKAIIITSLIHFLFNGLAVGFSFIFSR